jgi:hypothetical protein
MRIRATLPAVAMLAIGLLALFPGIASAHEDVEVGHIEMAVGFGTEPDTYAGLPNSVQLLLVHNGEPVVDLGDSLKVTIQFGDQTSDPMTFEPAFEVGEFGTPGDYRAYFVPSQPGDYTFHITGSYHETDIDESFTSGPETFSSVKDLSGSTFPAVQAPTSAELALRIQEESDRTTTAVTAATTAGTEAAAAASSAQDAADSAKTIGIIGIVVGAIGLIFGIVAFMATRKRA